MQELIHTEQLFRKFVMGQQTVTALHDVSIKIPEGRLTLLKGRSGSGKTTLMNLLGGLDQPSSGKVFFDGRDLAGLNERKLTDLRKREIGFVFQSVALFTMMSAFENVEFGLRVAGVKAKDRKNRAEECLRQVGLEKRMSHRPQELSGGEQQRVAIARALAHRPKIIFADEPTAELDTQMSLQVIRLFKDIIASEGVTIVMTSHDPGMNDIADHVITLEDGEIVNEC